MTYNPLYHHRRSIRLKGWDYTSPGAYFVTCCVKNRECLFGKVVDGVMRLNAFGVTVRDKWEWLTAQYPYVALDEYVVMPNHFHGILWMREICRRDDNRRGGSRTAPTETAPTRTATETGGIRTIAGDDGATENNSQNGAKIKSVGRLIGAFKTVSTKQINIVRSTPGEMVWQRDFYDHIGRNDNELFRIRQYIRDNPLNWNHDDENPFKKSSY